MVSAPGSSSRPSRPRPDGSHSPTSGLHRRNPVGRRACFARRAPRDSHRHRERHDDLSVLSVASALLVAVGGIALFPRLFNTPDALVHELRVATVFFAVQVLVDLLTDGAEACLEGLQRVDLSRAVDAVRRTVMRSGHASSRQRPGRCRASPPRVARRGGGRTAAVLRRAAPLSGGGSGRPTHAEVGGLFRYGRIVALLQPLGVLHRTMDRFIVGWILGPSAVTLVEIATQIQSSAESVLSASARRCHTAGWLRERRGGDVSEELSTSGRKGSFSRPLRS